MPRFPRLHALGIRLAGLAVLCALACATTDPAQRGEAADEVDFDAFLARADEALIGGDADGALEALQEARRLEPDHAELLFHFGRAYVHAGAHGAAYLAFAGYVTQGGTPERERRSRAALAGLSDRASGPLTELLRGLMREKKPREALGFIHLVRGYDAEWPVIQEDFREASCELLSMLAAAAFEDDEVKDAEFLSGYAIEVTRRCPLAFAIAARTAIKRGDRGQAARWFSKGLDANPAVLLFHRDLANLYLEEGDFERAILHLQTYLSEEIEPDERRALETMLLDTERRARFSKTLTELTGDPALPRASGTGFVVTRDGYALTAAHVVRGSGRLSAINADGKLWRVEVVFVDDESDVALIKLGGRWQPLALAPRAAAFGTEVFTIGFPDILVLGISPKLASGVVSSTSGPLDAPHLMQISVPIQPGNSGGPLLDARGEVVGLVVGRMLPGAYENVAYAVGSPRVKALLRERLPVARRPQRAGQRKQRGRSPQAAASASVVLVLSW